MATQKPPSIFYSIPYTLLHLITLLSISSLLLHHHHHHHLSATASASAVSHFEGFDADEDPQDDPTTTTTLPRRTPPPPTTLSTSSDHPASDPDQPPKPSTTTSPFDYWDEDEFEGFPTEIPPPEVATKSELTDSPADSASVESDETLKVSDEPIRLSKRIRSYAVEITCVLFLVMFTINYIVGKKENETLALAWAAEFATSGRIFDKNFSLLGVGEGEGEGDDSPLLLKEAQNVFKFYASGRRFCQGLVATMELKSRHDLIARLYNVIVRCKDEITVEVYMNEDAMDHVVFALAKKKAAKAMQKEVRDLQRFASLMTSGPSGRKWVADELMVIAESKEVAGDLITEAVLDQVFGEKAFEKFGKWFISMHFSDQQQSTHRKMLVFKFTIPGVKHMADMTRMVALVPYYIDLIGRYKLSSQARSKTEAARSKVAQEVYKELQNARQETLQRKKAERRKMAEETESKLNAESLRKREAKERARQLKKAMPKIKMSRGA